MDQATAKPPGQLLLRRARPSDAEAFAQMMSDPAVYPGTLQLPYASAEMWRDRLVPPAAHSPLEISLVAEVAGEFAGAGSLHSVGPAARRRHAMSLGLSVVGSWQGRGIGGALLGALCAQADAWLGVLRLELTVFADNSHAVALYERHGFVTEGRHRAYALRDGLLVDTLCMARLHPKPPQLPVAPASVS